MIFAEGRPLPTKLFCNCLQKQHPDQHDEAIWTLPRWRFETIDA
jgi:hypothetical protein